MDCIGAFDVTGRLGDPDVWAATGFCGRVFTGFCCCEVVGFCGFCCFCCTGCFCTDVVCCAIGVEGTGLSATDSIDFPLAITGTDATCCVTGFTTTGCASGTWLDGIEDESVGCITVCGLAEAFACFGGKGTSLISGCITGTVGGCGVAVTAGPGGEDSLAAAGLLAF